MLIDSFYFYKIGRTNGCKHETVLEAIGRGLVAIILRINTHKNKEMLLVIEFAGEVAEPKRDCLRSECCWLPTQCYIS